MVIDDDKLVEILAPKIGGRSGVRKHRHLIGAVYDLYDLGLTHKQLMGIFPVSLKWLRSRFKERIAKDRRFRMRPPGARSEEERRIAPADVKAILRKHQIGDRDLRQSVRKSAARGKGGW